MASKGLPELLETGNAAPPQQHKTALRIASSTLFFPSRCQATFSSKVCLSRVHHQTNHEESFKFKLLCPSRVSLGLVDLACLKQALDVPWACATKKQGGQHPLSMHGPVDGVRVVCLWFACKHHHLLQEGSSVGHAVRRTAGSWLEGLVRLHGTTSPLFGCLFF